MLTPAQIQAAADRIAAALHPKKIILFGSYARGDANEHSDLDLMIVDAQADNTFNASVQGRLAVGRVGIGVDVVAFDNETVEEQSKWQSSLIYWAVKEGKVLYAAE
jgi:uncharacterized protein